MEIRLGANGIGAVAFTDLAKEKYYRDVALDTVLL